MTPALEVSRDAPAAPAVMRLRSGATVWVRPIEPSDAELLRDAFGRLSERSRYERFHSGVPRLSDDMVRVLTDVDHHDREALIALADPEGSELVGVARYARNRREPRGADLAITIADEWHAQGLATSLLRSLSSCAARRGIDYFTVDMLADNQAIAALVRGAGGVDIEAQGAVVSARIPLIGTRRPLPR